MDAAEKTMPRPAGLDGEVGDWLDLAHGGRADIGALPPGKMGPIPARVLPPPPKTRGPAPP